jgi:hypothetical protein
MAKEKFRDTKFRSDTLEVIRQAERIIVDYQARGFTLTLRQLYYQFVSRDLIQNKQSEYKRLGGIIDNARQAGLLDWSAIEDRTRNLRKLSSWGTPNDIVSACADQYKEDLWADQSVYPEVWIEKDALIGVIEGVCEEFRVPFFACRGYASQSEMYSAAKRMQRIARGGREPVVFHLGDHDPSGIDMTRDNEDRLSMFSHQGIRVERLALNMPQIEEYSPPPNPAKDTDSRFEEYERLYGESSWELDALDPDVIADLISAAIENELDQDQWRDSKMREESNKEDISVVAENWEASVDAAKGAV